MDNISDLEILKRALQRERLARKSAESFIESKSKELFDKNNELLKLNETLEDQVKIRTKKIEEKDIELFAVEDETIDKYKKRYGESWKEELDKAVLRMKKEL